MVGLKRLQKLAALATDQATSIARSHFNILWEDYARDTELARLQLQNRQISLTSYRRQTGARFRKLRDELHSLLRTASL